MSVSNSELRSISILRNTGSCQSFIIESALPFSEKSNTGTDVLVRGIEMGCVQVPLHEVILQSDLISSTVKLGVRKWLPVVDVYVILGNDIAGGKVFSNPVVMHKPVILRNRLMWEFTSLRFFQHVL